MRRRELLLGLVAGPASITAIAGESAVRRKLNRLEADEAPAGWLTFSLKEVNALAAEEIVKQGLAGVRQPNVVLGRNTAIASARVDFAKAREGAIGEEPGPLSRLLLGGEKDVSVEAAFRSGAGMCQIDLRRAVINGLEIQGRLLDWLVENYLLPVYPLARVGKPFEIGYHVEQIEITPSRVRVRIVR